MIKGLDQKECKTEVFRLASISDKNLKTLLLEMGITQINLREIENVVKNVGKGIPISAEDFVEYSFNPSERTPPFQVTRFGDGTIGIYYSALEEDTCKRECEFHLTNDDFETSNHPRFYSMIKCCFQGSTLDLRGRESKYPELVSDTEDGYPFCQDLGKHAVQNGIKGFFTPSARLEGGTCVPVFFRTAVTEPQVICQYTITIQDGATISQHL